MMNKLPTALGLAVLLAASSALAQTTGNPAAGQALAVQVCATCHKVTATQPNPPGNAPSFAAIADMSSTTEMALHAFFSTPHANMPNLVLTLPQQDDVIAYILDQRKSR